MKNFRKQMAALMAVIMFVTCISFNGSAAEVERRWELSEDGEWTFWRNGEMVTGKMISETKNGVKKTYYLKEDGIMASDETFQVYDIVDGQDEEYTCYAYPDGHLAIRQWVKLNDEGELALKNPDGNWYYFGNNGERFENKLKKINGTVYYFDEDGKMLTGFQEWEEKDGESTTYYFMHDGGRAEGKWLYIDGNWYCFNSDGTYRTAQTASSSDADYVFDDDGKLSSSSPYTPCRPVESIASSGETERAVEVGEEVKLTFEVELATASNAKEQGYTKNHDWWVDMESEDNHDLAQEKKQKYENGKVTVTYIPKMPNTVSFKAVIDGVESDKVTVVSDWAQGEKADDQKTAVIADALASEDVASAVSTIKELSKEIEDSGKIKSILMKEVGALEQLDESYAMANRNITTQNTTTAAKALMGSGTVKLIGGSLNAEKGETVELKVDKGEEAELPETFEKQVSFGLNMYIGGSETSQLDVPVVIKMPIPKELSADGLKVYHITSDGPELLDTKVSDGIVTFVTDSFSDYVFAGKAAGGESSGGSTNNPSSSSSSSGSSSNRRAATKSTIPETPGSWNKLANGKWQFIQVNGAPYSNTWIYVNGQWYWINQTGIMAEGWQNINGKRYYLNPADGAMKKGWLLDGASWYYLDNTGAMQTGWVSVGGKWYYLNTDGVMMFNNMTPDGYQVDATGAWIK